MFACVSFAATFLDTVAVTVTDNRCAQEAPREVSANCRTTGYTRLRVGGISLPLWGGGTSSFWLSAKFACCVFGQDT